ncbi:MAG: choice-of-anchor Q domain-containing protein [Parcubacteria group bacterium]
MDYSTGNDTTGDGTSENPYKTFHKGFTMANADDILDLAGTFDWTNADETGDAATTGYTINKNLTILGHGPDQTIIQAASSENTAGRRVFTVARDISVSFQGLAIRYGKLTGFNFGGGILAIGAVTMTDCEVYSNRCGGGFGGGILGGGVNDSSDSGSSVANLTIIDSSFHDNIAYYGGGGVSYKSPTSGSGTLTITNSTIASNQRTATTGNTEGAGVNIWYGNAIFTNTTVSKNIAPNGSGNCGYSMNDPLGYITIKNSIVAGNTGSTMEFGYRQAGYGNVTDNGYNIIAGSQSYYTWTGATDWVDTNQDGSFVLYGTATTGQSNFDTSININDNTNNKTKTLALLSGSIAINNGSPDANGSISVPSTDQRGATRNGSVDIGAYEFDGGGLPVDAPATQASGIASSSVYYNNMTVSWTNGNGSRRVVFAKQASSGTASPVDTTRYSPSSVFGSGSQIGSSGWYAVYDGLGTSVTVTNLTGATNYIFQVFEYNGVGTGQAEYLTSTGSGNSLAQASYSPTTLYANSASGNDTTGAGTSGNPYKTFYKTYAMSQPGDTIDLTGTFTWTDADETGDAATTGYTISKDLTIGGHGPNQTIIQSASADNTADRRVFTVSRANTVAFQDLAVRYGRLTSYGYGAGIFAMGTITISDCEIYSNRSAGAFGGGVQGGGCDNASDAGSSVSNVTIVDSSIHDNMAYYGGGGITFKSPVSGSGTLTVTNSTISGNQRTATIGNTEGSGVNIWNGNAVLTNVTISGNSAPNGSGNCGIDINDQLGYITMKNSIIAGNTGTTYEFGYRQAGYGHVIDNGYNIIAGNQYYYTWTGATDWVDTNQDGSFVLYGTATTGQLNRGSFGLNSSLNNTQTYAMLENSITINNGSSSANGSVSVPSTDQRGLVRVGATDIGAYEYGATANTTPSLTSVSDSPDPVKGGGAISIAPSGQGDADSNDLYFYCNESGNPTAASNSCSGGPYSYANYGSMACSYNAGTGDTTRTVYCRTYDGTDYSAEQTTTYTVDSTAPSSGSITYSNGFTNSVSVALTAADGTDGGSGLDTGSRTVQRKSATLSDGTCGAYGSFATISPTGTYPNFTDATALSGNCYQYQYLVSDATANQATYIEASTVKVDTATPTTSDNFTHNNAWQNSDQTIALSPADAASGIIWTKYCTDSGNTCDPSSGTSYSGAATISAEGTTYFRYASYDNAGNTQNTASKTIKIDKTAPSVSAGSNQTKNAAFTQNAAVSDSVSGVASYLWEKVTGPGTITFGTAAAENTTISASMGGTYVIRLTATDNANNSSSDDFTLAWDTTSPVISSVSSIPSSTSATITWTSNKNSSSQVEYGLVSAYGNSTTEADMATRVSSHSVNLSSLQSCARYFYRVKSKDAAGNQGFSAPSTFNTSGCETSSISDGNSDPVEVSGGTVAVNTNAGSATVIAPNNYTSETATIQVNKLNTENAPSAPAGQTLIGDNFFNLLAVSASGSVIASFANPVTFSVSYGSDVENAYDENTLDVYKYTNGSWEEKNCALDTSANTLTCSLGSFSVYGVLGQPVSNNNDDNSINSDEETSDFSPPLIAIGNHQTKSLSANESMTLKSKRFTFRGNVPDMKKGDVVQIMKDGELLKNIKINSRKKWNYRAKQVRNTINTYQFRYLDRNTSETVRTTSEYRIMIDKTRPRFRNFQKKASASAGEYVSWTATDNDQIKFYQVKFHGKKYNLDESRFQIPANAKKGVSRLTVRAFDRAENSAAKKMRVRVK